MNRDKNHSRRKGKRTASSLPPKKQKEAYVWLSVLPDDLWLRVRRGDTVWEVLQKADVKLGGDCGGLGKCGKCKVRILTALGKPSREEASLIPDEELKQGVRLACRTRIEKNLVVSVGEPDPHYEYVQILNTGERPVFHLAPLVHQRFVTVPSSLQSEGLSDLDRVRLALGPDYRNLTASFSCLRTLSNALHETDFHGAAVVHDNRLLAWQEWGKVGRLCGMVFDIGTSTIVGKLVNMFDGTEVAAASCLNSQIKYGSNVISRLQHLKQHPNSLEDMHNLIVNDMNRILRRLLRVGGFEPCDILVAVAAGNTTMQHFLLGLSPIGIAEAPFSPVLTDGLVVKASDIGLQLNPEAILYTMPMLSGYIGGDLISAILASGAAEQGNEIVLGLDLGTNAEIFLGNGKRLVTCSAAAGPALEGANISHGMIASAGAIEAVSFEEGDLHYLVVGNVRPRGICGSGLVELVAVLLELGVIDYEGLISHPQKRVAEGLRPRLINRSGVHDFLVASTEETRDRKRLYLTQKDVRELQLAKGAIAAGVEILADEMGIGIEDIDRVYLAGALGNYVNPYSAVRIGLVPDVNPKIISSLGNAASTGASMALLSRDYWQMANELRDFVEYIDLSSHMDFNQHFAERMDFPQENVLHVYREEVEDDVMRSIKVGEVMARDFPTVPSTMALEEMSDLLRDTGRHGFPVLDGEGRLFGIATLADLQSSLQSGDTSRTVGDIATKELFVAYPDQSLHEVLRATTKDYGRIPVVDRHDRRRLVGLLRRQDIMNANRRSAA
ncbi:ASKHA domain-containing protein [Chloroflexota bacterium]